MRTSRLSESIYYIGVNDRTSQLFEGLWPLPYGVSLNSYLVAGKEKIAIIDGVEVCHALDQIDHIREIIGDRQPDYLVINHMEPDHSGSIRLLRQAFPGIKIVGNVTTLNMVKGFFGLADCTETVTEGSTIDLGGLTLQFHLTPMVHWPETMMTYIPEESTLFSGDAFGCFGALNGAVTDEEMDTEHYFPEMERYYSNIVGKYGLCVQRAFKKVGGLKITTLCTTHGPVWRKEISRVLDLYNRLSNYEPLDNGVTIVYGSMYGNTEMLAEEAATTLAQAGVKNISVFNASVSNLSYIIASVFRHRGLVIAAPTYSETIYPPVEAVLRAISVRNVLNREMALLGTCSWAPAGLKQMSAMLEERGVEFVDEPVGCKWRPGAETLEQCREMARKLAERLLAKN